MRHGKRQTRLGRQRSHRIATLRSLARSMILHQRIRTTHAKAKEARRLIEKLITIGKDDSLAARRRAFAVLADRTLVKRLFKDIAPLFANRHGGYTRIIPYNFRKGDGASVVFLELTEMKPEEKLKPAKRAKKTEKPAEKHEEKKPPKPKAAPEMRPEVKEEKAVEEIKKEKAKREDKVIETHKGIFKKVRGFFRRKTNM